MPREVTKGDASLAFLAPPGSKRQAKRGRTSRDEEASAFMAAGRAQPRGLATPGAPTTPATPAPAIQLDATPAAAAATTNASAQAVLGVSQAAPPTARSKQQVESDRARGDEAVASRLRQVTKSLEKCFDRKPMPSAGRSIIAVVSDWQAVLPRAQPRLLRIENVTGETGPAPRHSFNRVRRFDEPSVK